jgi:GNAT superfamily N-acetyltransferase
MVVSIRQAGPDDASALAQLAAVTFPLACPPHTTPEAIAAFIAQHLGEASFAGYLADPVRDILVVEADGAMLGYTMSVDAETSDADVAAALTVRPSIELSKFYLLAEAHGTGASAALMAATLDAARARGAAAMWLGVNQENARANRFYEKNGFVQVGIKHFLVGENLEDDFVRERLL